MSNPATAATTYAALQHRLTEEVRQTGGISVESWCALNACLDTLPAGVLNTMLAAIGTAKGDYRQARESDLSPARAVSSGA